MASDLRLGLDAFVRSIGINKGTPHALFLGAGASISSRVPSAGTCIWEWKRSIFLTNNPGLEAQFAELSLPSVRTKIQSWLDSQRRYPPSDDTGEYAFYIQECFPIAEDRRVFFQEKIRQASPHTGYKLAIALAEAGIIASVWTTNFDGLTAKAAGTSNRLTPVEVGIDSQGRLPRRPNRNEVLCVSMHGDYRYDLLKNTDHELQKQEAQLRAALIAEMQHTPMVVVGYSGRDASIMEAFEEAYSQTGTGTLYWCGFGDGDISPPVKQLIERARTAGRQAYYIPSSGFDDVMLRLTLHCLEGSAAIEGVQQLLSAEAASPAETRADFALPQLPAYGIIKSNAFLLTPPGEIYEFDIKDWPESRVWKYFEECTHGKSVVAAPFRGKAYAFGTIDDIRACFGNNFGGQIERVAINDMDLRYDDTVISSLIRMAVVRALAAAGNVSTDGREILWETTEYERLNDNGQEYLVHNALIIYLRRIDGKSYVVFKPTVKIAHPSGLEVPDDVERRLKLRILGWQHNAQFNQAVTLWRNKILASEDLEFPENCGSPFRFHVNKVPIMAKITGSDRSRQIKISEKVGRQLSQAGVELAEPELVFTNRTGSEAVTETHPIKGMILNRPFDYSLTTRELASGVRLGIVCPALEAKLVSSYLQGMQVAINPNKSEEDYLLPFPGFQSAFGTTLQVPKPGEPLWAVCPEVDASLNSEQGAVQLSHHITACIASLKAAAAPNVIVVFIPTRWSLWRSFETEEESFDLHDFIKAFCVPQGIATQFLEEDTLTNPLQCRIRWWLSLALYVKSMRTPWVLSSLDPDSAFVGFGISLDRKAEKGVHVRLGCSHLYNAQGEGLQFRLSKIENPVFRRGNAFLSYDDARRVGETIRQLFYESRMRLPGRVVIHKLTPFLADERKGLQAGLSGVSQIDLLEIHVDDALRYLSSIPQHDGTFKEDGYPVRRGSLVKLDRDSALLWVHGVARAVNPRLKYYQGKRRIPAPLVIKRYSGKSDLTQIGDEILGLSKMNWNSFDLYTKLPATVESSRQIAKIGSLLDRFGSTSYDYRLFM